MANRMGSISKDNSKPHAVVIPVPIQGHLSPFLHLCKALVASKGFIITFIIPEDVLQSFSGEPAMNIRFETVQTSLPLPLNLFQNDNRSLFRQAMVDMEKPMEELIMKINMEGPPISCIVSHILPGPRAVARKLGIPNVMIWTCTAALLLMEHNIPELIKHGDVPVKDPSKADVITYLPGLSPLPTWALPSMYSAEEELRDPGFTRRVERIKDTSNDPWILANSFEELEEDAFMVMRTVNPNFVGVGPLLLLDNSPLSVSLWNEDHECLTWLDKQEPESVLYISFGSLATISFEQFEELAAGLEELQQPFLWAIRPNSVTGMKMEEFNSFKSRVSEAGFGLVTSWAPQVQILKHTSTGGFLSHCGWNSTLESICAGVPIICWPCVAEQNLNCKLVVEDWKIGLRFSKVVSLELVYRHEFAEVVKKLMKDGDELRGNVKKLKEAAHKSVSEGGSSFNNLEKFCSSITS